VAGPAPEPAETWERSATEVALVELTDAGHRLIAASVERLLRHEERLIDHLSPAERAELTALLRKLLDGLIDRSRTGEDVGFGPVGS
jgi:DNA-binding MarR family transcriptional regulator